MRDHAPTTSASQVLLKKGWMRKEISTSRLNFDSVIHSSCRVAQMVWSLMHSKRIMSKNLATSSNAEPMTLNNTKWFSSYDILTNATPSNYLVVVRTLENHATRCSQGSKQPQIPFRGWYNVSPSKQNLYMSHRVTCSLSSWSVPSVTVDSKRCSFPDHATVIAGLFEFPARQGHTSGSSRSKTPGFLGSHLDISRRDMNHTPPS